MKNRFRIAMSAGLAFVMSFLLGTQPIVSQASASDLPQQETTVVKEDLLKQGMTPSSTYVEPEFLPLVPVAVAGFSWTVIDSIFAATLGYYVGTQAQDIFKAAVNDKQSSSIAQYSLPSTTLVYPSYPDFAGVTLGTKATKHMEESLVLLANQKIRDYGNYSNLRAYSSTVNAYQIMAVLDINSDMGGVVNRHLGNFLSGESMMDPNYKNEWLNLNGYTLFLVYNKNTTRMIHAHFTPTRLRDREIEYNRYVGQFDAQIFPFCTYDRKYLESDLYYDRNKENAMYNRGLLKDTKNPANTSVIPYK